MARGHLRRMAWGLACSRLGSARRNSDSEGQHRHGDSGSRSVGWGHAFKWARRCQWAIRGVHHGRMTPDGPGAPPAYGVGVRRMAWGLACSRLGSARRNSDSEGQQQKTTFTGLAWLVARAGPYIGVFIFFCNANPPELCYTHRGLLCCPWCKSA